MIERLTDDECAGLIKACQGKEFIDRRDEAIVRLMIETGMRAREVIGLSTDDVDLAQGLAVDPAGQGRQGPGGAVRSPGGPQHRPIPPDAPITPAGPHRGAVAGWGWSAVRAITG